MATLVAPIDDSLAGAVALAAAGDDTAFTRIIEAHQDDMTRVCFVICGDLDVADEAVQAAWPIVWRKVGDLRDPDRLQPWLVSIAADEARQLIRRRRRRTVVELATGGHDRLHSHDERAALMAGLGRCHMATRQQMTCSPKSKLEIDDEGGRI